MSVFRGPQGEQGLVNQTLITQQKLEAYEKIVKKFYEALDSEKNIHEIYKAVQDIAMDMKNPDSDRIASIDEEYSNYLFEIRDFEGAIDIMEKYDSETFNENLVVCYLELGEYKKAFDYLERYSKEPVLRYACLMLDDNNRYNSNIYDQFLKMTQKIYVPQWEKEYIANVARYIRGEPSRTIPVYLVESPISELITRVLLYR